MEKNYFVHESSYVDEPCEIGEGTKIWHFSHLMKNSKIGRHCNIGQNVVISPEVTIGDNVKIQNNVSVYTGVELEDDVFCGPSMVFTNVVNPRSHVSRKNEYKRTQVRRGATIGANATIVAGVTLEEYAFIGAGSVITKDVPAYALMVGVPARRVGWMCQCGERLTDKNPFGRIYMASCTVHWARPQEYYDQAPWRGTWEFDGGAFMNQASHYVDLIQWVMGPVESVMAKTATLARRIETEDSGIAILKFRSGALGMIQVTMLAYPRNLEGSLTILGEKGSAKIGGTAVNKIEHWEFAEYDDDDRQVEAANTNPPNVYGLGHQGYYRNVLAVLRGEAKPDTDGRAGRKSLELILGIYESAKTGKEVPLPLRAQV